MEQWTNRIFVLIYAATILPKKIRPLAKSCCAIRSKRNWARREPELSPRTWRAITSTERPMTDHAWNWSIDTRIPSIPAEGKRIVDELLQKLSECGWEEHDVFGIHLAVEEALVVAAATTTKSEAVYRCRCC